MLEFKNVFYINDGKTILNDLNVTIEKNDLVVITGPNGSGKSTLAKLIIGIITPTSGKIYYNGKDITDLTITERAGLGITFTFQTPITFKGLKVKDLLTVASHNFIYFDDIKKYLGMVGLCAKEYENRELDNSLSGGEQKRIEIASALAKGGELYIFDEPESGIDLWSFDDLVNIFKNIKKEKKQTTLIISHQEKILSIADKVILLKEGKIDKIGKKKEIMKSMSLDSCCNCAGEKHE